MDIFFDNGDKLVFNEKKYIQFFYSSKIHCHAEKIYYINTTNEPQIKELKKIFESPDMNNYFKVGNELFEFEVDILTKYIKSDLLKQFKLEKINIDKRKTFLSNFIKSYDDCMLKDLLLRNGIESLIKD